MNKRSEQQGDSLSLAQAIVDNRSRNVSAFLRETIDSDASLSIVSAYFTIYAYEALRDVLGTVGSVRFLYGEPSAVGSLDPAESEERAFAINESGGLELTKVLAQKPLAEACANWIRELVEIRTISRSNFLHGKLYHIEGQNETAALAGSSNFTVRGLGIGRLPNVELNIEVRSEPDRSALLNWFDGLWNDETLTRDAKSDVLAALERLGRRYSPLFVYYKTLSHVFEEAIERQIEQEELMYGVHLYDTEIWRALYSFQKDGATSAINRLLRHNGCIIADSVGLGKTWTALAVIKYFELRNERVLVLCPKRLEDNWTRYTAWAAMHNNPFDKDRLNYVVRAHTDLSRYEGRAGNVDLARFNWSAFDLVVIDESHNFRNEGSDRRDEDGNLIRRSRYNRLLEEVLKSGARTKVLMLSATPVNTSLRDLRNQLYLMTEKRQDAFRESLGITSIQSVFGIAQREFQNWERQRQQAGTQDKTALLDRLGADFLSLLDAVSLARSREHIRRFYPDVTETIGGFPQRSKPKNLYPATDSEGSLSYEDLHARIGEFKLAIYMPSEYLKDVSVFEKERESSKFDQRDRERFLIGMMRVNLLKRLESSVYAFTLTMKRMLDKMDDLDRRIEKWRERDDSGEFDLRPEIDEEDDEFEIGKGRIYQFDDINLDVWQQDVRQDRKVFEELLSRAEMITVERDEKLKVLKDEIQLKVESAPLNKDQVRNRKVLVFTTFADTATYLYEQLNEWIVDELGVHVAIVTGGDNNRSSLGISQFVDVLARFAPQAQQSEIDDDEIDVLIATDCLSEGQNLQDCDLVVNYDIHWNPVRLMQRFGRIDRLGSRNLNVGMVNFWPTKDLDQYLDLKNRVEARMMLADATATGLDDPLNQYDADSVDQNEAVKLELTFRDQQLALMRDEILEVEEVDDGVYLHDLTLEDFIAELRGYLAQNRESLRAAPLGIHAVVAEGKGELQDTAKPGVIFCLKRKESADSRTPNVLWPYFLVYVRADGTVRFTFQHAVQCLTMFRALTSGQLEVSSVLEDLFDSKTSQGTQLKTYETMLSSALRSVSSSFRDAELQNLRQNRGAIIAEKPKVAESSEIYSLVTWLVIIEKGA